MSAQPVKSANYAQLKLLIEQEGLLHAQPEYYLRMIGGIWMMLAASFLLLPFLRGMWMQLLDAAFMAFVFARIGFIVHDGSHGQVFHRGWKNDVLCLIHSNLLLGMSYGWWINKHNRHHKNPNQIDEDPDLAMFSLAVSEEQANQKRGLAKFGVNYQARLFFPMLLLTALGMRVKGLRAILGNEVRYGVYEAALIAAHLACYTGVLIYWLGIRNAIVFIVVQQALFGLYLGAAFAPNHIGMPIVEAGARLDFLDRQIMTTRNLRPSALTDFWFGGLNYQIEHHLFPGIARNGLREARRIVREFCHTHSISYCETGILESFRAVLGHLHRISLTSRHDEEGGRMTRAAFDLKGRR
jgi:fatty acid desaturase